MRHFNNKRGENITISYSGIKYQESDFSKAKYDKDLLAEGRRRRRIEEIQDQRELRKNIEYLF